MATAKALTTTVSTKGQIILPKAIRQQRRWHSGTRLVVEDTEDGVLLKPPPLFAPTDPKDVFGLLRHQGPPKTLEQMQAGIASIILPRPGLRRRLLPLADYRA
jgi:AbrB family looped-hinge helix DNA binding protein